MPEESDQRDPEDATILIGASSSGDTIALNKLLPMVYDNMRKVASRYLADERDGISLSASDLVHEAYVRLVDHDRIDWKGRTHFIALAATTMRRQLVDHARAKGRLKRGGDRERVTLESDILPAQKETPIELLELHDALATFEEEMPRAAKVAELRVFGELSVKEIAHELDVSERTVKGDWAMARAWLLRELSRSGESRRDKDRDA